MSKKITSKKITSYEKALQELQDIVARIEANTVGIDDLAPQMKRAADLIEFCQNKLRTTESEIGTLFGEE